MPHPYTKDELKEALHKGMHKDPHQSGYDEDENMRDTRLSDPLGHIKMNREMHGEHGSIKRAKEVMAHAEAARMAGKGSHDPMYENSKKNK